MENGGNRLPGLAIRLRRFVHPLVGASVAMMLALVLRAIFGGLGDAPAYKYFFPIAISGAAAAWVAVSVKGSQEKKLFLATLSGAAMGAACTLPFLKGEAVGVHSLQSLALVILLASGLSAATSLVLPAPPPHPPRAPIDPVRRRRLLHVVGWVCVLLPIVWWFPPPPWRAYWDLDVQEAAIRYLERESEQAKFIYTISGEPPSKHLLQRFPVLLTPKPTRNTYSEGLVLDHPECDLVVKWMDAVTARVEADLYFGFNDAQGRVIVIQLTPSGWKVVDTYLQWIT